MAIDLTTTNVLLGIMAVMSLLQGIGVVALIAGGFIIARRLLTAIHAIEAREITPAATRINAILDDVHEVTTAARTGVGHVGDAISWMARLGRRSKW